MATPRDYQIGTQALEAVVQAAIKAAGVPDFEVNMLPAGLLAHIVGTGVKDVIDAVDADRAKVDAAKGLA